VLIALITAIGIPNEFIKVLFANKNVFLGFIIAALILSFFKNNTATSYFGRCIGYIALLVSFGAISSFFKGEGVFGIVNSLFSLLAFGLFLYNFIWGIRVGVRGEHPPAHESERESGDNRREEHNHRREEPRRREEPEPEDEGAKPINRREKQQINRLVQEIKASCLTQRASVDDLVTNHIDLIIKNARMPAPIKANHMSIVRRGINIINRETRTLISEFNQLREFVNRGARISGRVNLENIIRDLESQSQSSINLANGSNTTNNLRRLKDALSILHDCFEELDRITYNL